MRAAILAAAAVLSLGTAQTMPVAGTSVPQTSTATGRPLPAQDNLPAPGTTAQQTERKQWRRARGSVVRKALRKSTGSHKQNRRRQIQGAHRGGR